jgi:16S rRNA processing protein RimM
VTKVAVGRITGCFGIKGAVKLHPFRQSTDRYGRLKKVFLGTTPEAAVPATVERIEETVKGIVVRFDHIHDRSGAESLVGATLFVSEEDVVAPAAGSYFTDDIVGCEVWTTGGARVGVVRDVCKMPAQDLWEVENGSEVFMIPAVAEFIRDVDIVRRRVTVHLIEGLRGQEDSSR